ncbi:type VI secretion system protein TssA [Elioraea sp.]|uniref:type VI secretion system protein TssA n=1 Tax=Elioraea sp. TaxID=2185103 RepID=UPI0021DDFABB|nr:type VI secretion system protein TssA [Elioraea sp.]GIX10564.1 MAG: type VI secretion protein [Elioraea sp.]
MALDGFDLARFLQPIDGEDPAGTDLRQDFAPGSTYYRLRDARAEARAAERAMDANPEEATVPPQWRTIEDLAAKALETQSKDLEIAAWYTEALLRHHGFAGLAAGVGLMRGLVESFWDGLHPRPDEDGIATTVAAVAGLNGDGGDGTLAQPIRKVPLFADMQGNPIALWQIEQADALAGLDAERREARIAAGALTVEAIERAAALQKPAHWAALIPAIRAALEAWQALGAALDARAGRDAPPTSAVRGLLEQVLAAALRFAGPNAPAEGEAEDEAAAAETEAGETSEAGATPGPRPRGAARPGEIATREDALRLLEEVARWFRRSEPHSPLSYTLEEAVRRGRMTLPDLLQETLADETARNAFLTALGIRPPAPPEE